MGGATSDRLGEAEGRASHGAALSAGNKVKITHTHFCFEACMHATAQPNDKSAQQSLLFYKLGVNIRAALQQTPGHVTGSALLLSICLRRSL